MMMIPDLIRGHLLRQGGDMLRLVKVTSTLGETHEINPEFLVGIFAGSQPYHDEVLIKMASDISFYLKVEKIPQFKCDCGVQS